MNNQHKLMRQALLMVSTVTVGLFAFWYALAAFSILTGRPLTAELFVEVLSTLMHLLFLFAAAALNVVGFVFFFRLMRKKTGWFSETAG